jgi:hypothetical protein
MATDNYTWENSRYLLDALCVFDVMCRPRSNYKPSGLQTMWTTEYGTRHRCTDLDKSFGTLYEYCNELFRGPK